MITFKTLAKVIILVVLFFIIGIYINTEWNNDDTDVLYEERNTSFGHGETEKRKTEKENSGLQMPDKGLALTIGKTAAQIKKQYGDPVRVDPSSFGYDWWIYNLDKDQYFQLALKSGKVVSAYGTGEKAQVDPFYVGEPLDELYSSVFFEMSFEVETKDGSYRLELSEDDLNIRPLLKLGKIYAQVYVDKFNGTVSSIRFLDTETLLRLRPYELTYSGALPVEDTLSDGEWVKVEEGSRQQIFDLTNIIRKRFSLPEFEWNDQLSAAAYLHSSDMAEGDYFSHTSPTKGDLSERLEDEDIPYSAAGENIAANYVDGIAAVEGWLNSKNHREEMLNEEFTELGVGVYHKFYTQNFISK